MPKWLAKGMTCRLVLSDQSLRVEIFPLRIKRNRAISATKQQGCSMAIPKMSVYCEGERYFVEALLEDGTIEIGPSSFDTEQEAWDWLNGRLSDPWKQSVGAQQ